MHLMKSLLLLPAAADSTITAVADPAAVAHILADANVVDLSIADPAVAAIGESSTATAAETTYVADSSGAANVTLTDVISSPFWY